MQFKNVKQRARLDKISQASSPDGSKQQVPSPLKNGRGRINFGGMGSSYLSFFRIEKQQQIKDSKLLNEEKGQISTRQMIEVKNKQIEDLQEIVTTETIKKNAREKSFSERVNTDWSQFLEKFIKRLSFLCITMSKSNLEHKKIVLKVLHKSCNKKSGQKQKVLAILGWILQWIQPILKMMHEIIKSKFK